MKTKLTLFVALIANLSAFGAGHTIAQFPNTATLASNMLFVVEDPAITNKHISWGQLTNLLNTVISNSVIVLTNSGPVDPASGVLTKKRIVWTQATGTSPGGVASFTSFGWIPAVSGTTVSVSPTASTHAHSLLYSSTALGTSYFYDSSGTGGVIQSGTASYWTFRIAITNTSNYRAYVGLSDLYPTSLYSLQEPTNHNVAIFRFSTNSANWWFITGGAGGTGSYKDTGLPASTADVEFSIALTGSTAIAYTNGVACCTNSTLLPSGTPAPVIINTPLDATAHGLKIYSVYSEQAW